MVATAPALAYFTTSVLIHALQFQPDAQSIAARPARTRETGLPSDEWHSSEQIDDDSKPPAS
jgi:hypothetical protein